MVFKLRITFLSILLCLVAEQSFAQTQTIDQDEQNTEEEEDFQGKKWKDRIVVGGNLSAQFGNTTYIEVAPIVGYRITERLTSGIGFSYQYISENYNVPYFDDYKGTVYSGRLFSQFALIYGIFAHAEYEYSKYKFTYENTLYGSYSGSVPAFFVGGGYNYKIGSNANFQIIALYDVLHTNSSIYANPWTIRVGFNVGL